MTPFALPRVVCALLLISCLEAGIPGGRLQPGLIESQGRTPYGPAPVVPGLPCQSPNDVVVSTAYPGCTIKVTVATVPPVCGAPTTNYWGVLCADGHNILWQSNDCGSRANILDPDAKAQSFGCCGVSPPSSLPLTIEAVTPAVNPNISNACPQDSKGGAGGGGSGEGGDTKS